MIPQNSDQYRLPVILHDIFLYFFIEIGKKCFEEKQGILDLKIWCQLMGNINMNK